MAKKNAKKLETVEYKSPWVTARFPKLNKPDVDGEYADGKFKTDAIYDENDVEAEKEKMKAAWAKLLPNVPFDEDRLPMKEFVRNKKDEDGKVTETINEGWGFRAKSKRKPAIFDSKLKKLPEGVVVGGGSVIRIAGALAAYKSTEKVKENGKVKSVEVQGLTLYLNKVQVKDLKQGTDFDSAEGFEEVEGFEYEEGAEGSEDFADDAADL